MSSLVDTLFQIKYNPFKYGEYLASFYSTVDNVENNLLLSQLVIPLCSHPIFQEKIERAIFGDKRRSTIWSIFKDRERLYDLQERINEFRLLTDQCLQYSLINDWLEIKPEKLQVVVGKDINVDFVRQKSGENLGKLFSNLSVIEIYAFLGVKPR